MTKQEIVAALVQGKWTSQDIEDFYGVLKDCRSTVEAVAKYQFSPGDTVQFTGRRGKLVTGTVVKRLQKRIRVQEPGFGNWSVPPSMLTKV